MISRASVCFHRHEANFRRGSFSGKSLASVRLVAVTSNPDDDRDIKQLVGGMLADWYANASSAAMCVLCCVSFVSLGDGQLPGR
jgi:hypothetical protein